MAIKKEGEHLQSTIGERIKEERLKKGWTQTQLGEIVGCSAAAIMRYEKGERKVSQQVAEALADAFGTTPTYILGWEGSKQAKSEEGLKHQPPFIQYLHSLGYDFEYVDEKPTSGIIPNNQKRKPCLSKDGSKIVFTEKEFKEFEKSVEDAVLFELFKLKK